MTIPWTLCSKEDVSNIHPVAISDLEDEWSVMVEALIRQHMSQPYLGLDAVTITDEYHNGDGTSMLLVKKPPIVSVTGVYLNDVTLTSTSYVVFDSYVQLKYGVFTDGILNVKISYTSGVPSNEVDPVVRLAAASMIVAILNYRRSWGADSSLKWGEPDDTMGERSPNYNVGLTSHLTQIMKRLLRRPVVRVR